MLPDRLHTTSWAHIERFYEGLVNDGGRPLRPMLDLVRSIAASPYAAGLHPVNVLDALLIGPVADFARGDKEIRITFDDADQTFLFTYTQRPGETEPWSRVCDAASGRATFDRLLHKRLRWFHEG